MVLTTSFELSPGTGLSCPRRPRDHDLGRLDISVGISGPHDFAVRFAGAPVLRTQSVHRIPRSTFVTTRNAPPDERGTARALLLFLPSEKAKYFLQESWTRRANQCHRVACDICAVMAGLDPAIHVCGPPAKTPTAICCREAMIRRSSRRRRAGFGGNADYICGSDLARH
jgi:hypothetical protein